jgi:hypothetical protein
MARKRDNDTGAKQKHEADQTATEPREDSAILTTAVLSQADEATDGEAKKNGGWREVEAMREKAALKASLADVWDEDFDLDEEILAELDHTAEFFTPQKESDKEIFDEDGEIDELFDDEEV